MMFENLTVDRVIIHEVHRRKDDKQALTPEYGQQLLKLEADALDFFRERVLAAMGSQSQCMEMTISKSDATSAVAAAHALLTAKPDTFVQLSRAFADKLASAQMHRGIPGGIVLVFTGNAGNPSREIVGVIKAETHTGFRRTSALNVQFLKDLFLTPQTKLYKIGIFAYDGPPSPPPPPKGWTATVYDKQMTTANRDGAAQYFYEAFLGCELPTNSAQLTKRFFDGTREFIQKLDLPEEQKSDLVTGLYAYLRVDKSPTVEIAAFSNQYLASGLKDDYRTFMKAKDFPTNAVPKDISDIQGALRKRKLRFSKGIEFSAPTEAFDDLVEIKTVQADGASASWTQILIRDHVRSQL